METMDVRASPYGKLLDARSALLSRAHWWMEGARRRRSGGASAALSLPGVQPKPPQPSCSTHSATDPTTHRLASPSQNRSGCAYSPRKNQWFPFHRLSLHRSPPPLSILVQHGTEWLLFVFSLLHWLSSDLALCTPILPPPLRPPSIMSSSIPSLSLSLYSTTTTTTAYAAAVEKLSLCAIQSAAARRPFSLRRTLHILHTYNRRNPPVAAGSMI